MKVRGIVWVVKGIFFLKCRKNLFEHQCVYNRTNAIDFVGLGRISILVCPESVTDLDILFYSYVVFKNKSLNH